MEIKIFGLLLSIKKAPQADLPDSPEANATSSDTQEVSEQESEPTRESIEHTEPEQTDHDNIKIEELRTENEELKRKNSDLESKNEELTKTIEFNNRMTTPSPSSNKNAKDSEVEFVQNLKKHLTKTYNVLEHDIERWIAQGAISNLIASVVKSLFEKNKELSQNISIMATNNPEVLVDQIARKINELIENKKDIENHICEYLVPKYTGLPQDEKDKLLPLVVRILSGKITGLKQYEGKSFQELADAIQAAMARKSDEEVITGALSKGVVVRKDDMANDICQQINEQVKIDSLALAAKSVEELVNCVSEKLQQKVDQAELDTIAAKRAKEQIEESKKDSTTQIASLTKQVESLASEKELLTKSVQKAKDDLEQANNKFKEEKAQLQQNHQKELDERKNTYENNKRQLEEKHSSDIQKLNQEHELTLLMEQEKATAEKNKALEELTQTKDAEISKVTAEKEAKTTELEKEKGEHSQTKESLKLVMTGYAALIKNTFEQLNNTIAKAKKDSDDSASILVAKIVDNKAYGLEEFMEAISKISGEDAEMDFATYNSELKNCVLECLETKQPTWIDWLVRLAQYANVPFIAEQFAQQNLSLVGVGEALQATQTILHSLGIQLEYPVLFNDTISDKYDEESIRNIDSYVNDIANHCSGQKGLIIDIYKAGYSVDGEQKRKTIVSKFN